MDDLYEVLGVSKVASQDEIKKAYRDGAFKWHPDRNSGNTAAEEQFKRINAAYSVLGDETKRAQYDRYGSTDAYAGFQRTGNYSQESYAPGGQNGDPFWDWFQEMGERENSGDNDENSTTQGYRYYGTAWHSTGSAYNNTPVNNPFGLLIRSILYLGAGVIFLPASFIVIPIGPILCLMGIISGLGGIVRALRAIFR